MKASRVLTLMIILIPLTLLLTSGCSKNASSKNMEQLYAENGVPVKTKIIESSVFSRKLEFNAVISGERESSAYSSLSEKIENIFYKVGDYVEQDAIVLTFPFDNPNTQYFQTKLAYENALASFERVQKYFDTGGLSRQEFDNAKTSFKVAEANWNSIRQAIQVKAPISGVITRINFRETDNVKKDDELFTIARIDKVKARVWASDKNINDIENGQHATAEWNGHVIEGKVVQVDMSMNQERKAFAVDVVFDNSRNLIRTGVTANITVEVDRRENSIIIDRKNIITENDSQFVYLNRNGVAKRQPIKTGMTNGTDVEVIDGLHDGDELIVEGQMLLSDNKKINLVNNR